MTEPTLPLGGTSTSFADLLRRERPELLAPLPPGAVVEVAHATTILAVRHATGVLVAGDRRATEGSLIAHRDIQKVFPADRWSAVAIAGAAGPAMEMVRLFQTELEHYEKVEGEPLSLEGKANRLAAMVREHLPMAFQGLAVLPLFAGYDLRRRDGRIFRFDVAGGRYEDSDFHATGSGGKDARNFLKAGYRRDMDEVDAVRLAVRALFEAADEDSGTGGPDIARGIFPNMAIVDSAGYRTLTDEEVAQQFREVLEAGRTSRS